MNVEATDSIQPRRYSWKKRAGVLVLLLVAIIGGLVWVLLPPKEPSYQGKPLSYWLTRAADADSIYDTNDAVVVECREAIRGIGTNAIPTLLRLLRAKDSVIKEKVIEFAERKNVTHFPLHLAEEQKQKALYGFFFLGNLATNAIPDLIDIYKHPSSERSKKIASEALMTLYPAPAVAVPHWVPSEGRAKWYFTAGMLKSDHNDFSNAVLAFSEAIKMSPTNNEAYASRAVAKMDLHDLEGAVLDFEKVLELSPSNYNAIFLMGYCKFARKEFKDAEADFTAVVNLQTNDSRAYNYRGLARANLRDMTNAVADLDKAIDLSPREAEYYRNRAQVEALQKEYEKAFADASKAIELDPRDVFSYTVRGRIQSALKEYDAALLDFDRALALNSNDAAAYASRGLNRVYVNDFESASADLEKALQLDPKAGMAYMARGVMNAKRGGEDGSTLADIEHAVELTPQAPEARALLGAFQYKARLWEQALANLRAAVRTGRLTDAGDANAYIWLIRAQSGEQDAANTELEAYLKSPGGSRTNEWSTITARFLSGGLPEGDFLVLATTSAKRPTAVRSQVSESLYYAGMKRKIAGDTNGAMELFQKCVDFKNDNTIAYLNAGVELRSLKQR